MSRPFNRIMLDVDIGGNLKLGRLTPAERWAHVAGVLCIAGKAPIRGCFTVGNDRATAQDVARQAGDGVSVVTADSTLRKLRATGVLFIDDDLGCERVHDWDDYNPSPKRDETAAERARRYRASRRAGLVTDRDANGAVTAASRRDDRDANGSVTPPEVEGEEQLPIAPSELTDSERIGNAQQRLESESVDRVFSEWVTATERDPARTKLTPDRRRRIVKALTSHGLDVCLAAARNIGADPWARGENDRGRRFDDLSHALGSTERIERWAEPRSVAPKNVDAMRRTRRADALQRLTKPTTRDAR